MIKRLASDRKVTVHINMNPRQFQPPNVSVKVKQAALRHNLRLLQSYYTFCRKLLWFIIPEVVRVFVVTV